MFQYTPCFSLSNMMTTLRWGGIRYSDATNELMNFTEHNMAGPGAMDWFLWGFSPIFPLISLDHARSISLATAS